MTDKITEPIAPDVPNPAPLGPLSGNWRDDDAQVYEDDFTHADLGPVEHKGMPHPVAELKPATRILARDVTVGTVNGSIVDPVMIFPRDLNRKSLAIVVTCISAGTYMIGSGKSDCYNGTAMYALPGANTILALDMHTGAVWAYSTSANAVLIAAVAVTE